jgi:hypothetical protein
MWKRRVAGVKERSLDASRAVTGVQGLYALLAVCGFQAFFTPRA